MNLKEQSCVEAVGERLKAKCSTIYKDRFRDWIWIVPGSTSVDAYVPLPVTAAEVSTEQVTDYINRIVKTDLLTLLPLRCTWHIVLCGLGWTAEIVTEIEAKTQPYFQNDQVKVLPLETL